MVKAVLVQYRFVLPVGTQHSSYTYQKLFRAIYGYTQNVSKSSGKTYRYHRPGVLSAVPYNKPGKNTVLVPKSALPALADFFKTGKNPSHEWHVKGDWKAVYYTDEREVSTQDAAAAVETAADRILSVFKCGVAELDSLDEATKGAAHAELAKLTNEEWARDGAQTPKIQRLLASLGKT